MSSIYVNSRFLTQPQTGAQVFAGEISRRLKKSVPGIKFVAPAKILNHSLAAELECMAVGKFGGHVWEQFELPLYLLGKGKPLLLNLVNTAPLIYGNQIVTVHDLSFMHYPDYVSRSFSCFYNFLIPRIIKNASHVFTVSDFAKRDICDTCGTRQEKVTVVRNAAPDEYRYVNVQERSRTVICVGSQHPLKNYSRVISAFLKADLRDCRLLLVGSTNRRVFSKDAGINEKGLPPQIVFTGYKSRQELLEIYNSSSVLVIPSLYESFGIPALEAMRCGCAVIASKRGGLPEVCGDAAMYVDPESIDDISCAIRKMIEDKSLRSAYASKGLLNAAKFSWDESASRVAQVILKTQG